MSERTGFVSFVYICIAVEDPSIQRGLLGFHKPV